MNQVLNEISASDLVRLFPVFKVDSPVADFVLAFQSQDELSGIFQFPCRYNGFLAIVCLSGELEIHLNLKTYTLHPQMVFFCEPGNIIQIRQASEARFYLSAISENMAQEMAPDCIQYYKTSVSVHFDPCLSLQEHDFETVILYNQLLDRLLDANILERKEALLSYVASLMFFLRSFWKSRTREVPVGERTHSARTQALVDGFIRLVTEHHLSEHYLSFYAKELGITPKYLSKLVREVTGRSAPDWIDSFLVLEAKNLLKYSSLAIKEIVFRLHFPDQSSFYKFFKLHTGMIPSEYRKS